MSYLPTLEHKETMRELRYTLMRFARASFYTLIVIGFGILIMGLIAGLIGLMGMMGEGNQPFIKCLLWFIGGIGLFLGGIGIFTIGVGAIENYTYETYMPTLFIRKCPKCGQPLRKNSINYFCPNKGCLRFLPMGLGVWFIRMFSWFTTYLNIAYAAACVMFIML